MSKDQGQGHEGRAEASTALPTVDLVTGDRDHLLALSMKRSDTGLAHNHQH